MAEELRLGGGPTVVKLRNPWGVLGLLLVTLGIYGIFWWYFVNREMSEYGAQIGHDLGQKPMNSALAVFPGGLIIIPALITYWRGTLRVQETQRVTGVPLLSGWLALVLYILLAIAFPSFIQSELNKAWRAASGVVTTG